jgi:ring-1,2-phenylacetyl-CoA epoxidase subunit PaaB
MSENTDNQGPIWEVFIQSKPGLAHKHAGNLHAADKEMALQNARDLYTRRQEGTCIWVVPFDEITSSSPENDGAFFDPANDKAYRNPTHYIMPEGSKHI